MRGMIITDMRSIYLLLLFFKSNDDGGGGGGGEMISTSFMIPFPGDELLL